MADALSTHSCPLVSVIVVSCQRQDLLSRCLEAVASQTYGNLECRVFLNRADADIARGWKEAFPNFTFEYDRGNQYYCKPCNGQIASSKGDFILCLNDDVVLLPSFIKEAVRAMSYDKTIGSVNGRLVRDDGETLDSTGFFWSRSRKPYERAYGRRIKSYFLRDGYIFGANGAAAFYRRDMLEDVRIGNEYFDEDFGIYYEDFDLSWRARSLGWKAYYCSKAIAYHKRGATTRTLQPLRLFKKFALTSVPEDLKVRLIRNRYATMIKNDRWRSIFQDLPWIVLYEAKLLAYLLLFQRRILAGILKDRSYIVNALRKRRKILDKHKKPIVVP